MLQMVVAAVILCAIAVGVMRWVFARYTVVNRVKSSALNTGTAQGFAATSVQNANWPTGTPPDGSTVMDSKPVTFKKAGAGQYETTVADQN